MKILFYALVFVLINVARAADAPAPPSLESMADELLKLRAEVENAAQSQEDARKVLQSDVDALLSRRSELQASERKERLRGEQIAAKRQVALAQLPRGSELKASEQKALLQWAQALRESIAHSIPFELEARLAAVDALIAQLRLGKESDVALATQLLQLSEKELRMTHESVYAITPDAETARLGRLHLLYIKSTGEAGYSVREGKAWRLQAARNDNEREHVQRVMERFRTGKRSGYMEIPGLVTHLQEQPTDVKELTHAR